MEKQSKVIFENRYYSVCLTKAGLSVQNKLSGAGKILPPTAKGFNDWVKQFESCLDNVESHWLAKGFLS